MTKNFNIPGEAEANKERELATILAALRHWKVNVLPELEKDLKEAREKLKAAKTPVEAQKAARRLDFLSLPYFEEYRPLTRDEIDVLCEGLRGPPSKGKGEMT